jgi:hypothetical protein
LSIAADSFPNSFDADPIALESACPLSRPYFSSAMS